jgi:protein-S-isoprenylcysteine O-methyltransferase Ste14
MVPGPAFHAALIGVYVLAAVSFVSLLFFPAPYGRHDKGRAGPQIDTRLGWVLMESPASLVFAYFYFRGPNAFHAAPLLLFIAWQLHYFHRSFIYPFLLKVRAGTKMTAATVAMGAAYCAVNGYLNGSYTSTYGAHLADPAWLRDPRLWIGLAVFAYGYFLNKQSDRILRDLRAPGETGYKIPHGGGYRWVSSPNYLGELLTWIGFAIASWSPAALSFVVMTAANLVPRALSNHRWYCAKFPDYPRGRKAIVPYVL